MMINLSDTHISVASLADLNNPQLQSTVEIAPYDTAVLRFGDYVVEEIQSQPYYGWSANQDRTEFRVKQAGGNIENKTPVATFSMGQVARVFKHGDHQLVAIRYIQQPPTKANPNWQPPVIEAQVFDLTDPTNPRKAGKATLPNDIQLYYGYWCGDWFWGAWGFNGSSNNIISTTSGLQILGQSWQNNGNNNGGSWTTRLISLDLTSSDAPAVTTKLIETVGNSGEWWASSYGLAADPVDPAGFYLTYRKHVGDTKTGSLTLAIFKDYAQRWDLSGGQWAAGDTVNLPGRLTNTYLNGAGQRIFVAQDYRWSWIADPGNGGGHGASTLRLALLRQIRSLGRTVAELLDSKTFDDIYPSSMVIADEKLMVVGRHQTYGYFYPISGGGGIVARPGGGVAALTSTADPSSDRLMIYDLSAGKFGGLYDSPTGMYNSDLVGHHNGRLLMNLQGEGFLVVDLSKPAAPNGVRFVRTLGWANNIEFAGGDVYIASGYYGVQHFTLADPPSLLTN